MADEPIIQTLGGWSFARWAYVAAWHKRRGLEMPSPTIENAMRMRAHWKSMHPVNDPWERPTSADMDFAWAAALFSGAGRETQWFRANLRQEKGAGDHESPTP